MPSEFSSRRRLSPAAQSAIHAACCRQLDLIADRLRYDRNVTLEECRAALEDWQPDETLVIEIGTEEQLRLLEELGDDYGLELGEVDFGTLRSRIESLAAYLVASLGECEARQAFEPVEELLEEKDLEIDALLVDNPYEYFRHYGERDEPPWTVYEYRNLEGEGIDVDLFELGVAGNRLYVRQYLAHHSLRSKDDR